MSILRVLSLKSGFMRNLSLVTRLRPRVISIVLTRGRLLNTVYGVGHGVNNQAARS